MYTQINNKKANGHCNIIYVLEALCIYIFRFIYASTDLLTKSKFLFDIMNFENQYSYGYFSLWEKDGRGIT